MTSPIQLHSRLVGFGLGALVLIALAQSAEAQPYARGRKVYIDNCVSCHSIGWKNAVAKAKTQYGPDLTRIADQREEAKLTAWIRSALFENPQTHCRARVTDDSKVRDLVFFLKVRRFERPRKPVLIEGLGVGTPAHSSVAATAGSGGGTTTGLGVVKNKGGGGPGGTSGMQGPPTTTPRQPQSVPPDPKTDRAKSKSKGAR